MTPEQAAAFVMGQAACASAELLSMVAANALDAQAGRPPSHSPSDFAAVPDRYTVGHNAVLTLFQDINKYR